MYKSVKFLVFTVFDFWKIINEKWNLNHIFLNFRWNFDFSNFFLRPEMAGNRSKDRILNIFLSLGVISSVEEFRYDLKAKINIGAYPGGGLIYRYPLKTEKKRFFIKFTSGLGRIRLKFCMESSFGIPHSWYLTWPDPRKVWYIYPPPPTHTHFTVFVPRGALSLIRFSQLFPF